MPVYDRAWGSVMSAFSSHFQLCRPSPVCFPQFISSAHIALGGEDRRSGLVLGSSCQGRGSSEKESFSCPDKRNTCVADSAGKYSLRSIFYFIFVKAAFLYVALGVPNLLWSLGWSQTQEISPSPVLGLKVWATAAQSHILYCCSACPVASAIPTCG